MKFSIIVPIYNVEKYLNKCLDSLVFQTYDNFEVIMICDDSTDDSNKIVNKYVKKYKNFRAIYEKKTGLAKARNIGISLATGDYLLFLDGDDFLNKDLLLNLNKAVYDKPDIVRYQISTVENDITTDYNEKSFETTDGISSFKIISKYHFIENSWAYAYNHDFWKKNEFKFMDDCIAEDFGLTPLIIAKADKVKAIPYIGYNYVQRDNSLMNNKNYEIKIKKMKDMLKQATYLKKKLKRIPGSIIIENFIDDSLIYYSTTLKYGDYKKYNKVLKQNGCFKHLKGTTFKSKIRCILLRINSYIFFKIIRRGL